MAFKRDDVIAAAVDVFWEKGFDGASLDDLTADIGISRSTLYNSFGGKGGLYDSASTAYLDHVINVMISPLLEGSRGIDDLIDFLQHLGRITTNDDMPAGCLIVNAMATASPSAETDRYIARFEEGFRAVLSRSAQQNEIAAELIDPLTSVLVTQTIGLNIVSKSPNLGPRISESIEGLITTISTLRKSHSES